MAQVEVRCIARTCKPTPHGPTFLHRHHDNKDNKKHLANVVDPTWLEEYEGFLWTKLRTLLHVVKLGG